MSRVEIPVPGARGLNDAVPKTEGGPMTQSRRVDGMAFTKRANACPQLARDYVVTFGRLAGAFASVRCSLSCDSVSQLDACMAVAFGTKCEGVGVRAGVGGVA
jgi:hypothetical protein